MTKPTIGDILTQDSDKVAELIAASQSMSDVLKAINISPTNTYARKLLKSFMEDKQLNFLPREPISPNILIPNPNITAELTLQNVFTENSEVTNSAIIKYILRHDFLEYKCSIETCGVNGLWQGKVIALHLDHKNGNSSDNRFENLRFLCPNCHSQTDTYTARNSNSYKNADIMSCERCGEESRSGNLCRACKPLSKKDDAGRLVYPSVQEILNSEQELTLKEILFLNGIERDKFFRRKAPATKPQNNHRECPSCGGVRNRKAKICRNCFKGGNIYPPLDVLVARITADGYEVLSRELGVSGNSIRKYVGNRLGFVPKRGDVVDVSAFVDG